MLSDEQIKEKQLSDMAKCCCLLVSSPHGKQDGSSKNVGTAFFIDRVHLLTARHNVTDLRQKIVYKTAHVTIPGTCFVNYSYVPENENVIICDVIAEESQYDVAILKASGFCAKTWTTLDDVGPSVNDGATLIGYPCIRTEKWILEHPGIADVMKARDDIEKLLPTGFLSFSAGTIRSCNESQSTFKYDASTCPGLSGGLIVRNGKVIGTPLWLLAI